jgi:hypothetical protein
VTPNKKVVYPALGAISQRLQLDCIPLLAVSPDSFDLGEERGCIPFQ